MLNNNKSQHTLRLSRTRSEDHWCILLLGGETFVGKHRGQTFVVVFQQVCTDLGRDFGPLLFADPLRILKVP